MEQEFVLLLLSLISLVIGFALDRYGFGRYKKPVEVFLKALDDGKLTEGELKMVLKALEEVETNDKR